MRKTELALLIREQASEMRRVGPPRRSTRRRPDEESETEEDKEVEGIEEEE
jgi:hypothetical protein